MLANVLSKIILNNFLSQCMKKYDDNEEITEDNPINHKSISKRFRVSNHFLICFVRHTSFERPSGKRSQPRHVQLFCQHIRQQELQHAELQHEHQHMLPPHVQYERQLSQQQMFLLSCRNKSWCCVHSASMFDKASVSEIRFLTKNFSDTAYLNMLEDSNQLERRHY